MELVEVMQQIGKNIKRYRKRLGLTQEQLAQHMGTETTRGTISKYETGKWPNMTVETLNKLANALEVNIQDLFIYWPEGMVSLQDFSASLLSIIEDEDLGICPAEVQILQQMNIGDQFIKTKEKHLLLLAILRMVKGGNYKVVVDELLE